MDMINTIDEITYELMIKIMSSGMTNFMLFMSQQASNTMPNAAFSIRLIASSAQARTISSLVEK